MTNATPESVEPPPIEAVPKIWEEVRVSPPIGNAPSEPSVKLCSTRMPHEPPESGTSLKTVPCESAPPYSVTAYKFPDLSRAGGPIGPKPSAPRNACRTVSLQLPSPRLDNLNRTPQPPLHGSRWPPPWVVPYRFPLASHMSSEFGSSPSGPVKL